MAVSVEALVLLKLIATKSWGSIEKRRGVVRRSKVLAKPRLSGFCDMVPSQRSVPFLAASFFLVGRAPTY